MFFTVVMKSLSTPKRVTFLKELVGMEFLVFFKIRREDRHKTHTGAQYETAVRSLS